MQPAGATSCSIAGTSGTDEASGKGKKKKKTGKAVNTNLGDDEIDALLMELDGPTAKPAEAMRDPEPSQLQDAESMLAGRLCSAPHVNSNFAATQWQRLIHSLRAIRKHDMLSAQAAFESIRHVTRVVLI